MAQEITKEYLKNKQYGTTKNLEARIQIHKLFSTNPESFHKWIAKHYTLDGAIDALDIGCGTGIFWQENNGLLPEGSALTVTDFSEAMVEKARANVRVPGAVFEIADAENLSYDADSFDVVLAHHMIYHTSDKAKALNEIKRVLRPGGFVSITTNSERHMKIVYEIGKQLDPNFPTDRIIDSFTEEIAAQMLPEFFPKVEKFTQEDVLEVTDFDFLLDYIASGVVPRDMPVSEDFFQRYAEIAAKEMEKTGHFDIPKRSALFQCWP